MNRPVRRTAFLLSGIAMVAYCASQLRIGTDITNFMPDGGRARLASLSRQLANSDLTRTMILSVGADTPAEAVAAALELEAMIAEHPEVAWIRSNVSEDILDEARELYFTRRYYFASDNPEAEIPLLVSPAGLEAKANALLSELRQPSSAIFKPLAMQDPLGLFRSFVERARRSQPDLPTRDGQLVSQDGRFALIMLATAHSHFASDVQAPFLDDLRAAIAELQSRHDNRLTIEMSGANRIAVHAEQSIKRDVYSIGAFTCVGVAALFFLFFRSPAPFFIAMIPALFGMLTGITAAVAVLGGLDGLSIAFGAALVGVAIDYSIHVINHHALLDERDPFETARRLAPSLLLGAATTMASFAGLVMTTSPAIRELGFLSIVGIGAAIATTLTILPAFMGRRRAVPELSHRAARFLQDVVDAMDRRRPALFALTALTAIAGLLALPHLHWVDDLSRLGSVDRSLIEEDVRVRSRLPMFESGRFVISIGPNEEQALRTNDVVFERLRGLTDSAAIGGIRSLHQLLWSTDLQRRNLALLRSASLREPLDRAFRKVGFRPGVFEGAFDDLESPPPPLTLDDLRDSALGPMLSTLALPIRDGFAVITYLREIHSLEAVESAVGNIDGVVVFDQKRFVNEVYSEFRSTSLRQVMVGSLLVAILLLLRYRSWRPALAAILPALLVVVVLLGGFAAFGVETNLLHVISLMMVMGMGVDYGIFLVDTHHDRRAFGSTMLSLLLSCLTTVFVFGALAISEHPALRAIGTTTGFGVLLAFLFAPVSLLLTKKRPTQ